MANGKKIVIGTTCPEIKPGGIPSFIDMAKQLPQYEDATFLEWCLQECNTQLNLGNFKRNTLFRTFVAQVNVYRYSRNFSEIEVHSIRTGLIALILFRSKCTFFYHGPGFQEAAVEGAGAFKLWILYSIELIFLSNLNAYITASEAFRIRLRENIGVSLDRITVLRPRLDFDHQSYKKALQDKFNLSDRGCDFRGVICRRLINRVGILEFLAELRSMDSISNIRIDIIGGGPLEDEIRAACQLDSRVNFIGSVSDEDRDNIYALSHFNLVPTLHLEGLGMVIYEGAQYGAMPMVLNCGGMPELIDEICVGRCFNNNRELIESLNQTTLIEELSR